MHTRTNTHGEGNKEWLCHQGEGAASILLQVAERREGAGLDRGQLVAVQAELPEQEAGEEGHTERAGGKARTHVSEESQTPPPPPDFPAQPRASFCLTTST